MLCPDTIRDCDNPGCRHGGCQGRAPLNAISRQPTRSLPRPEGAVTSTTDGKEHLVISRDNKARTYEIEGSSTSEKIRDVVGKVLGDGHTAEWLP